ncbi:MAG: hypothetical protein RLZZ232_3558 [Planctomycetota bacterium]|jgi:hypothetical protein
MLIVSHEALAVGSRATCVDVFFREGEVPPEPLRFVNLWSCWNHG